MPKPELARRAAPPAAATPSDAGTGSPVDARFVVAATLVNGVVAVLVLAIWGVEPHGIELALRITARVSFVWFLLAYLATPLATLRPSRVSRWLMWRRRELGIVFGLSMSMHVAFILRMFVLFAPERPPMVTLADFFIGIPGLVFVALMTVTSFDALKRALGPVQWGRLHRTGLHVVWAIFFLCLVDSVGRKEAVSPLLEYHVFIALLMAALLLRVAAARRRVIAT